MVSSNALLPSPPLSEVQHLSNRKCDPSLIITGCDKVSDALDFVTGVPHGS
jgi:hypothetical protein